MSKFVVANQGHVVNCLAPVSLNGGKTCTAINMRDWEHASIILTLGAAVGSTIVTIEECSDASGTGAATIAFSYYKCETSGGDVLSTKQSATASGFATASNTTSNIFYVLEIDASQLTQGKPYIRVKLSDPGAQLGAVVAVLSGGRYEGEATRTAIA